MGLFDRFTKHSKNNQNSLNFSASEAFAAIVLIVIAADGYLSEREISLLNTILGRMQLYRQTSVEEMRKMFDELCGLLKSEGPEILLKAGLAALPKDLYDTTFAVATDLVLADGKVTDEEEDILADLRQELDLSEEIVEEIINVMIIKNKG